MGLERFALVRHPVFASRPARVATLSAALLVCRVGLRLPFLDTLAACFALRVLFMTPPAPA